MIGFETLYFVWRHHHFGTFHFYLFGINSLVSVSSAIVPIPLTLVADNYIFGEMLPPCGSCKKKHWGKQEMALTL